MATILVGDAGKVDFSDPIEMTQEQFDVLITGLKKIYDPMVVHKEETRIFREKRLGEYFPMQAWDDPYEYKILMEPISTEEKSRRMGRSYMSIMMHECIWLPQYYRWKAKSGKLSPDEVENIKNFLKEIEIAKAKKKKVSLLQCVDCRTYHDPRHKDWKSCEICAGKLKELRVSWEERRKFYEEQTGSEYKDTPALRQMMRKYPLLSDDML